MKDKFNYTAQELLFYQCPCCFAKWRDSKPKYCPNCEVKILYSAGEEVYVKCDTTETSPPNAYFVEGLGYIKKLTRPVVTVCSDTEHQQAHSTTGFCSICQCVAYLPEENSSNDTRPVVTVEEIMDCASDFMYVMEDDYCRETEYIKKDDIPKFIAAIKELTKTK